MSFERLDSNSEKLLKYFYERRKSTYQQLTVNLDIDPFAFKGYMDILLQKELIQDLSEEGRKDVYMGNLYEITTQGDVYFDIKRREDWLTSKDTFLRVAPIIISIIALIKSFWPEITSLWKQLMQ